MKTCIVNIAIGNRYMPLAARLAASVAAIESEGATLIQWINDYPPGSPKGQPLPFAAYQAKPFAFKEAANRGYDLILWVDAACWLLKPLDALWKHVDREGYYLQDNGWNLGEWSSDAALKTLGIDRETAFTIPEISTMALALDMRRDDCRKFVDDWAALAADGITFPGAHTNSVGTAAADRGVAYRNTGFVSSDPRVMGHRHDQTAATALAWRLGWKRTPRPVFAGYAGLTDERTLIVNKG